MSVKRRDLIKYLLDNGFVLMREGKKHAIFADGRKVIPVKRAREIDRITANEICKQAGLEPKY